MPPRAARPVHWADLDGLRALAILLVLGRHSLRPFMSEDAYRSMAAIGGLDATPLLMNGWVGVDLFFVLSGFLIGRQAWGGTESLARFWFRRAARILPAYWTCLAVVAVALTVRGAWAGAGPDFLAHVALLQDYTGSVFVAAFWSLGAEEKFYLLAPLLVLAVGRLRAGAWQAAALAALWLAPVVARAAGAPGDGTVVPYDVYFASFRSPFHLTCESLVLGFTVAWAMRDGGLPLPRPAREALFWTGTATVLALIVPSPLLRGVTGAGIVWIPAAIGLAFGSMLVAVVSGPGTYSAGLGWRGWHVVATGAYTLYLTHMMMLPAAFAAASVMPWAPAPGTTAEWAAFLPWYLALSAGAAGILHRYVERPALAWRDRVLAQRAPSDETIAPRPSLALQD